MSDILNSIKSIIGNPDTKSAMIPKIKKALAQPLPSSYFKKNNSLWYLPIDKVRLMLSAICSYYEVEQIYPPDIIANSCVVTVRLKLYFFDKDGNEFCLTQDGVGATAIQSKKVDGGKPIPMDTPLWRVAYHAAVQMSAPAARSYAVSNAAKEFGLGAIRTEKNGSMTYLGDDIVKVSDAQDKIITTATSSTNDISEIAKLIAKLPKAQRAKTFDKFESVKDDPSELAILLAALKSDK